MTGKDDRGRSFVFRYSRLDIFGMKLRASILLMLVTGASQATEPLACNVGPILLNLGGATWQVTSCNDGRSLVFATAKDNPAMPFYFFVQRTMEPSSISGEGNGDKQYSAAAFDELKSMTEGRFDELVKATLESSKED